MVAMNLLVSVVLSLVTMTTCYYTTEERFDRLIQPDFCHSKECPPLNNNNLRMDFCSNSCPEGTAYICIESSQKEKQTLEFCTPTALECKPGEKGHFTVDGKDPNKVIMTMESCPKGSYQQYTSDCINTCKKYENLHLLPSEYVVYSNGSNIDPPKVYCNYRAGYYNPYGIMLLDFDDQFQFNSGNRCVHVSEKDPCEIGKVPLPNKTCVFPCHNGYMRDDHDFFRCTIKSADTSGPTFTNTAGDAVIAVTARDGGGETKPTLTLLPLYITIAVAVPMFVALVVLYCFRHKLKCICKQVDDKETANNGEVTENLMNGTTQSKESENGKIIKEKGDNDREANNVDATENLINGTTHSNEFNNGSIIKENGTKTRKGPCRGAYKKTHNDTITPSRWDAVSTQHRSVGCIIAYGRLCGTVFRVGRCYTMTAFHVILPLIKKDENGPDTDENIDWSQLTSDEIYMNFNQSALEEPRIKSKFTCVFYNPELDVAVLKFEIESGLQTGMILDRHRKENLEKVYLIGYGNPKDPDIKHIDPACEVLNAGHRKIKKAQDLLSEKISFYRNKIEQNQRNLVDEGYRGYDEPHKIVISCFLEHGASGGPLITVANKRCIKVVGMITHGMPEFYFYLSQEDQFRFPKECRFEYGTRMSSIFDKIHENDPELAKDLFGEY